MDSPDLGMGSLSLAEEVRQEQGLQSQDQGQIKTLYQQILPIQIINVYLAQDHMPEKEQKVSSSGSANA